MKIFITGFSCFSYHKTLPDNDQTKDYISVTGNFLAKFAKILCHENFGQYIKLSDYTKHIEGKIRSTILLVFGVMGFTKSPFYDIQVEILLMIIFLVLFSHMSSSSGISCSNSTLSSSCYSAVSQCLMV